MPAGHRSWPPAGRGKGGRGQLPPGNVGKHFCVAENRRFNADGNHAMQMQHGRIHRERGTSPRFMRCSIVENPWQRQNVNKATQNALKCTILRAKVEKFSGEGTQPPPRPHRPRGERDTPSPHSTTCHCPLEKNPEGARVSGPADRMKM